MSDMTNQPTAIPVDPSWDYVLPPEYQDRPDFVAVSHLRLSDRIREAHRAQILADARR